MTDNFCGTGFNRYQEKPGDPDNSLTLTAVSAYGGVDLSWTTPVTNDHAVAYTIIFRGATDDPVLAVERARVSANVFHDPDDHPTPRLWYYWIQNVSINGTILEKVGPASATAKPKIEDYLRLLTNKIDAGHLAQTLSREVNKIGTLEQTIESESALRQRDDGILTAALSDISVDLRGLDVAIRDEVKARSDGYNSLAASYSALFAKNAETTALITEETAARVTANEALAKKLSTLTVTDYQIFEQDSEPTSAVDGDVWFDTSKTPPEQKYLTVADDDSRTWNTGPKLDGKFAEVRTETEALIEPLTGHVTTKYTVVLSNITDADGEQQAVVGGFGLYNDSNTVQAGFDVDTFWVGRTGVNGIKPFIIENDEVFINSLVVKDITLDKLRTASGSTVLTDDGKIKANLLEVQDIDLSGYLTISSAQNLYAKKQDIPTDYLTEDGDFRGTLNINADKTRNTMKITNSAIKVYDENGTLRVQLGDLST